MSMDARYQTVAAALRELPPEQPGRTLDLLARMLALTDQDVSDRTAGELKRPTVNQKRSGRSPVKASDLWPLAEAVGVDVDVLLLPPSQAARWLAEHRSAVLDAVGNTTRQHNGGELSTDTDRSRCTDSRLYFQLYRSMMGCDRAVARVA